MRQASSPWVLTLGGEIWSKGAKVIEGTKREDRELWVARLAGES
jgi:hypothetical protein